MKLQTLRPKLQPVPKPREMKSNWGKGRGGRPWRRLKESIHVRDGYTCQLCGLVTHQLECDHKVNTAQGGTDDPSNLWSLCIDCHKKKTQQESRQ